MYVPRLATCKGHAQLIQVKGDSGGNQEVREETEATLGLGNSDLIQDDSIRCLFHLLNTRDTHAHARLQAVH